MWCSQLKIDFLAGYVLYSNVMLAIRIGSEPKEPVAMLASRTYRPSCWG